MSFETVNSGSKGTISTQIKTVDVSKMSKVAALVKDFPAVGFPCSCSEMLEYPPDRNCGADVDLTSAVASVLAAWRCGCESDFEDSDAVF